MPATEFPMRTFAAYRFTTGFAGLALVASTWRLWMPQDVFPQVPLVRVLPLVGGPDTWAPAVDYLAIGLILLGFIGMIVPAFRPRRASYQSCKHKFCQPPFFLPACYAIGFCLAVIIDQHRLQPWAVQFLPLSLLFSQSASAASPSNDLKSRLNLAKLLVVGIYVWSALGKLDYQFAHTVGHGMLVQLLDWIGVDASNLDHDLIAGFALILPVFEGLGVAFLCLRPTRKLGVYLIITMHLILFFILGPFGQGHKPGVLVWNLFSMVQVWLLFGTCQTRNEIPRSETPVEVQTSPTPDKASTPYPVFAGALILAMLVLPLGERVGIYDHWLSWALYAPHSSRVALTIPITAIDSMPSSLQNLITQKDAAGLYAQVPLDAWSLEQLDAPIYPQARFQLGVAMAVAERAGIAREAVLQLRSVSRRVDGSREIEDLKGSFEMRKATGRFLLNAQPSISKYHP